MNDKEHTDHNAGVRSSSIRFCDPRCEYASFPDVKDIDGSGSCRTFSALWCSRINAWVTRNAPCQAEFGKRRPKSRW